jgi:phosphatidylglycerol:prolipoprotein diacylglycerol transferase
VHGLAAYITIDVDPVVHIGGLAIHWYGVMYAVAFWVAWRYAVSPHLTARGVPQATVDKLVTWSIVVGLLGARLYYDVQSRGAIHNPIDVIAVWNGGMAFFGAILADFPLFLYLAWRYRLNYWLLADASALFAVVGQPIGRIGNIINGDILGSPSTLPWATAYTNPNAVLQSCCQLGVPYQPAAAYEMIGTILIGVILLSLRRRGVRVGWLAIPYVALYAVSQLIIFVYRNSEPTVLGPFKQAQVTALVVLAVGVPALIALWRRFPPANTPSGSPEPEAASLATPAAPAQGAMA